MREEYQQVREFMLAFGQCSEIMDVDRPSQSVVGGRARMSDEECREMSDSKTITEYFDACLDQLYVVLGHFIAAGITPEKAILGFKEVHRSNMTKFWKLEELVSAPDGSTITKTNNGWFVVIGKNGKVIKSPSYSPANLKGILT